MSVTTYKARFGDTFADVSRRVYGEEKYASRIASANPGVTEPIRPDTILSIVPLVGAPLPRDREALPEGVTVYLGGKRFDYWESAQITRSIDDISSAVLTAPLEEKFADFYKPFSFSSAEILLNGEPIFTGSLVNVVPTVNPSRRSVSVSFYGVPGVLIDSNAPAAAFPLEWDDATLETIAKDLAEPFGVSVVFEDEASGGGAPDRIAMEKTDTIHSFLSELARKRGLVVGDNPAGALVFRKGKKSGRGVAWLEEGRPPLTGVTPTFNAQAWPSSVTAIGPTRFGKPGKAYTARNSLAFGTFRPHVINANDSGTGDLTRDVEGHLDRLIASAVTYRAQVATWEDQDGNRWAPNTLLKMRAPGAMVYKDSDFLIKSVTFSMTPTERTATLSLVLPGAYAGSIPEALPWER